MLWGNECRVHMGACFSGGSRDAPVSIQVFKIHLVGANNECRGRAEDSQLHTVVFRQVRNDHLCVALGAQCA